jgi:tetratricopeptide (TPR) repeat protein
VAGRDLTRQAVHLVETGKTRPSRRTLQIIARRLGVPVSTFLVEGQPRASNVSETRASEFEQLWRTYQYADIIELGRQTLEQEASPRLRALAYHYTGLALIRTDRSKDALDHLRKARELFRTLDDPWFESESMDWEAAALYLMEDQRALPLAEEALRRYRTLDPRLPATEARILEHIAMILAHNHAYERSKAAFEEALEVVGTVRDLSRMGRIYHGLSKCYQHIGDLNRATEFAHKALAVVSLEQDQAHTANIENELGLLHMRQGQLDRAEQLFLSALEHMAMAGAERNKSHFVLSLGELRERQGRLDESIKVVKDAIDLAERLDEAMAVATGYQQLGSMYAKIGEDRLFRESFERAMALLEQSGSPERLAEARAAYETLLGIRRGGGKAAGAEHGEPRIARRLL